MVSTSKFFSIFDLFSLCLIDYKFFHLIYFHFLLFVLLILSLYLQQYYHHLHLNQYYHHHLLLDLHLCMSLQFYICFLNFPQFLPNLQLFQFQVVFMTQVFLFFQTLAFILFLSSQYLINFQLYLQNQDHSMQKEPFLS